MHTSQIDNSPLISENFEIKSRKENRYYHYHLSHATLDHILYIFREIAKLPMCDSLTIFKSFVWSSETHSACIFLSGNIFSIGAEHQQLCRINLDYQWFNNKYSDCVNLYIRSINLISNNIQVHSMILCILYVHKYKNYVNIFHYYKWDAKIFIDKISQIVNIFNRCAIVNSSFTFVID